MLHSVILPVLNGERHIRAALDSALPQLASDDEVIVVDNGSTDGTLGIVAALGDPRVRIAREGVKGPAAARNAGLALAAGEVVSFLDHDDLWPDGRNAALLAALAAHPDAAAAYGRLHVRFDAGHDPLFDPANGALSPMILLGVSIFRRAAIERTGKFAVEMPLGSDVEFLLRFLKAGGPTVPVEHDALVYRRHETNITHDLANRRTGIMSNLARHLARKRGESAQ